MAKNRPNIYGREGTKYHAGFQFMVDRNRKPQTRRFKRSELIAAIQASGATIGAASACAGVLLSPSEANQDQTGAKPGQILSVLGRGDCRGNFSARGEHYFTTPHVRKEKNADGKLVRQETEYTLHWRKEALAPHHRRPAPVTPVTEIPAETSVPADVQADDSVDA